MAPKARLALPSSSSSSSSISFQVNPDAGFWPNFQALLAAKFSPAESERLLASFQRLHEDWFKSLSLSDLDTIAAAVEHELGNAIEAPE